MQDLMVYLIVGGAAVYLVRHWLLTARGEKGCGGCGSCGKAPKTPQPEKLVQIDLNGSWKR